MGVNTGLVNMWCSFELLSRNTDDVSKKQLNYLTVAFQ